MDQRQEQTATCVNLSVHIYSFYDLKMMPSLVLRMSKEEREREPPLMSLQKKQHALYLAVVELAYQKH